MARLANTKVVSARVQSAIKDALVADAAQRRLTLNDVIIESLLAHLGLTERERERRFKVEGLASLARAHTDLKRLGNAYVLAAKTGVADSANRLALNEALMAVQKAATAITCRSSK